MHIAICLLLLAVVCSALTTAYHGYDVRFPTASSLDTSTATPFVIESVVQAMCNSNSSQYGKCNPTAVELSNPPELLHKNSTLRALHNIRWQTKPNGTVFTWEENYRILHNSGHLWCSILRDNHACFGTSYAKLMSITTPFQGERYNLLSFDSPSTRILAVGNSHLLELLYLPVCASLRVQAGHSVKGWHLRGNNFIVQARDLHNHKHTTILILDNDDFFASAKARANTTMQFLEQVSFAPTHIILGSINGGKETCNYRSSTYAKKFPSATIVCRCAYKGPVGTGIAQSCRSDGLDCVDQVTGHQCVPSPGVITGAERLWSELLQERPYVSQCVDPFRRE